MYRRGQVDPEFPRNGKQGECEDRLRLYVPAIPCPQRLGTGGNDSVRLTVSSLHWSFMPLRFRFSYIDGTRSQLHLTTRHMLFREAFHQLLERSSAKVHAGFYKAYTSVDAQVLSLVRSQMMAQNNLAIICTGKVFDSHLSLSLLRAIPIRD